MRFHCTLIILLLMAVLCACTAAQDSKPDAATKVEAGDPQISPRPPVLSAEPLANFARMLGGEWKMTAQSGTSLYDSWHWGPGKHSLRMMTEGEAADGSPWRALQVVYWHPGRNQVLLLSMHPNIPGIGRGVGDGTIRFDGDTSDAIFDLYQPRGPRNLRSRSIFEGPDKYHATLLESTGPGGYQPLADWDHFRVNDPAATGTRIPEEALKLPEELRIFESFVGRTWDAKGKGESGEAFHIQSTFEFVPIAEYVYGRTVDVTGSGKQIHTLDVYFYHHVGTDGLRCLALSNYGGVYEGDVIVLDSGGLQINLDGYEGERIVSHIVRFDFEAGEALRQRVWSLKGSERVLMLEVLHKRVVPKQG